MKDTSVVATDIYLHATAPLNTSHLPEYLLPSEQIKKIHSIELANLERQVKQSAQLSKIISILTSDNTSTEVKHLNEELKRNTEEAKQAADKKKSGMEAANRIVNYFKSSLNKPKYQIPPIDYKKTFQRTSPKIITYLTGTFDPSNPQANFSHMWSKLMGYGQANYFSETEYKNALSYTLKGDAYETYLLLEQTKQTLEYMLDYFGKMYTPKRSLNALRKPVDNFTRNKNESLEVAMHRCLVAVDKLRIQYSDDSWPVNRNWLRRDILSQIITEETRRFIRLKEDNIMENFGILLDIEEVIKLAHKYELEHMKAPETEVSTIFQVASGGLAEDFLKMKSESNYLKKTRKNTLLEILTNPVMTNRYSPEKDRENRRNQSKRDHRNNSQQRQERQKYGNPNRNGTISFDRSPPTYQQPPYYQGQNSQQGRDPQEFRNIQRPYNYKENKSVSREWQPFTSQQSCFRSDSQNHFAARNNHQWSQPPYPRNQLSPDVSDRNIFISSYTASTGRLPDNKKSINPINRPNCDIYQRRGSNRKPTPGPSNKISKDIYLNLNHEEGDTIYLSDMNYHTNNKNTHHTSQATFKQSLHENLKLKQHGKKKKNKKKPSSLGQHYNPKKLTSRITQIAKIIHKNSAQFLRERDKF